MKPTQVTELFANIKKTFVSFFSILMFVALGVGIFVGITWASPALQNAADEAFADGSFHNFQLQYLYGLTDDDLSKLAEVEGVTDIEPARQSFQTVVDSKGSNLCVKVQAIPERIDVLTVLSGELPAKADDIALSEVVAQRYGYNVGDTITFQQDIDESNDADLAIEVEQTEEQAAKQEADTDGMKFLNGATYTITALVESPEYLAKDSDTYGLSSSSSGSIDMLVWVPASAFDANAYRDGYPVVNVACDSLAGLGTFTDEYKSASSEIEERLTTLATSLAQARYSKLHGEAESKVNEGESELNEAKEKVANGEKELEEGRAELEAKRTEGEEKLANAYNELLGYEALKQQGEVEIAAAREKIAEGEQAIAQVDAIEAEFASAIQEARSYKSNLDAQLKKGKITQEEYDAELDANGIELTVTLEAFADKVEITIPVVTHENYDEALDIADTALAAFEDLEVEYDGTSLTIAEARVKLADGKQQLAAAESEYAQKVSQLEAGWAEYYAGQETLKTAVAEGEEKIAAGEKSLEEARSLIAENEPKLKKAKEQLAAMEDSSCAVMSRSYNGGVAEVSTFSGVTSNLSISMAALFIIVGLLVSYSAVSRIVHEQVSQIGTKKALGFRSGEITSSFLLYSAIAVVIGAIVGTIVGVIVVEGIIGSVIGSMFTLGSYPPYIGIALFFVVTLVELVLVLGATWLACRGVLKKHAIELLRGEGPTAGKTHIYEKWGAYEKSSLFVQTMVNNCINDKRRMFATIVGVAGCTALIVTAITLNNDVLKSYDAHYDNVYGFNAITYVDDSVNDAASNVEKKIEEQGFIAVPALREIFILSQPDGGRGAVRLVVPADEEQFEEMYHVNAVSGSELDLSAEGVWVSQAYAQHFGAKVGDLLSFEGSNGAKYEVPILGISEFWLTYHEIVMGRAYYKSLFGVECSPNAVLTNTQDASVEDIAKVLESVAGYDSIVDDKAGQHKNFETFSSVSSAVVLIYIALSVLMAIVVLLNLNVMFINEKKRELIVLMINGFSVKDAKRYIRNDSVVLSAIGIVVGVVVGCIMGSITVGAIEPSTASFVKAVDPMAVLIGVLGSAVLCATMSTIALRRVPRFDLTDINRF